MRSLRANLSPASVARGDRIAVYAVAAGEALGMTDRELLAVRYAAELWELGEGGIPRRHRFLAGAVRLIRDPSLLGTNLIAAARAMDDAGEAEELFEGMAEKSGGKPEVVEALRRVRTLIQPMHES